MCRCFSFITVIVAPLYVFVNVLSVVRFFKNISENFYGIFWCYAIVIPLFVAMVETELGFMMKSWIVFEYWAGRGMLQTVVDVMTRAFSDVSGGRRDPMLHQKIASYLLIVFE